MLQIKNSANPQYMLNQILANNPNTAKALDLIKQNGGNAEQAFYNYANQIGVNPQQFLNQLRG